MDFFFFERNYTQYQNRLIFYFFSQFLKINFIKKECPENNQENNWLQSILKHLTFIFELIENIQNHKIYRKSLIQMFLLCMPSKNNKNRYLHPTPFGDKWLVLFGPMLRTSNQWSNALNIKLTQPLRSNCHQQFMPEVGVIEWPLCWGMHWGSQS